MFWSFIWGVDTLSQIDAFIEHVSNTNQSNNIVSSIGIYMASYWTFERLTSWP